MNAQSAWAKWLPLLWFTLAMSLLQLIGPQAFRYQTGLIEQGQWWRVLSAHLVHANWIHLALNLAGLALCIGITGIVWRWWQWLWRCLLLMLCISASFFLLQSKMGWYVGFSGVLMGLYLLAAFDTRRQQPGMSIILAIFILSKIGMEQFSSVNMTTQDLIGVPVMVDAHLYGVVTALAIIALQYGFVSFQNFQGSESGKARR